MNCNEEYVIKALGKLTLEFNFDWEQQRKIGEILHLSLYGYDVLSQEKGLVAGDLEEKIMLYIKVKKLENYADSTLKNYLYDLVKFSDFIKKPVATINKNDIRFYLSTCYPNLKPSSMNAKIFVLKGFFRWLEDEEIIPKNPTRLIKDNKLPKRLRKSLTLEELEKMRIACKNVRERAILEFIFATGCRVGEVVNTNTADIDFSKNKLTVIGKGNKQRQVYINDKTKVHIENYLNTRRDNDDALFVSEKFPYNRMQKRAIEVVVSKIGARANLGKDVYPHLIRHTMATLGLRSGADLTTIQHLLGHSSPSTTQTYAEESEENLQHEYNQHFIQ